MQRIEQMTVMSQCARGQTVYAPGETREALLLLTRGRVEIYRLSEDGKRLLVSTVGPGMAFGDMALTGQRMHGGYAEAVEDCMICVMSRADVEALLDRTPWRHLPTGVVLDRIWTGPSAGYERANLKEVVNIIFWANGTVDHHILVYRAGEHVMSAEVNPQTASAEFHEGEHRLPDVKASHFRTLRMGS